MTTEPNPEAAYDWPAAAAATIRALYDTDSGGAMSNKGDTDERDDQGSPAPSGATLRDTVRPGGLPGAHDGEGPDRRPAPESADGVRRCRGDLSGLPDAQQGPPGLRLADAALTARAEAAEAKVARLVKVHGDYFDTDREPFDDASPEPEDVWRFDRDFRAALAAEVTR